jgi:hypothetical protein
VSGQRDQVRIAEAFSDSGGAPEAEAGADIVVLVDQPQRLGQQQVSQLHTVSTPLIEQPAGPREPPAGLGRLASLEQAEREPEGAARGRLGLVSGEEVVVGASPVMGGFGVLADQPGRGGKRLKVLGSERRLVVRGREPVVRLVPGTAPHGVPAKIQRKESGGSERLSWHGSAGGCLATDLRSR